MAKRRPKPAPGYEAVARYRRRFRQWTMEALPTMTADEWERLTQWVMAWGYKQGSPVGSNDKRRFRGALACDQRHGVAIKRWAAIKRAVTGPVIGNHDRVLPPGTIAARRRKTRAQAHNTEGDL